MDRLKYLFRAFKYRYLIDANEIRYIRKKLKKGQVAVDIGCHKGGYLYWLRRSVGRRGRVYAFEPQAGLYEYLEQMVGTFGFENITVENKGVSNREGVLEFHIPISGREHDPGARLEVLNDFGLEWRQTRVEVVTLDAYFLSRGIIPDLIKVDVEGHEKKVIEGGEELIRKHRPTLLVEIEQRHIGDQSLEDTFGFFLRRGYQGYFFHRGKKRPIRLFDRITHQGNEGDKSWGSGGYVNNFVFER